jgi:hypothetical protein
MGLFKPAWDKSPYIGNNEIKAIRAINKLTDQTILADIAENGFWESYKNAAIEGLTNQLVLANIAKSIDFDSTSKIGQTAVKNLTSQDSLIDVARNAYNWKVRRDAVMKIDNKVVLTEIAKMEKFGYGNLVLRLAAAKKLDNPSILNDINFQIAISTDMSLDSRIEAIEELTDQTLLVNVVRKAYPSYQAYDRDAEQDRLHHAAVDKMTDQTLLAEVAKANYRVDAVNKITDQTLLTDIASSAEYPLIRFTALDKISDQVTLAKIAKATKQNPYVRQAAEKKINGSCASEEVHQNIENCLAGNHDLHSTGSHSVNTGETYYTTTTYQCRFCGIYIDKTDSDKL